MHQSDKIFKNKSENIWKAYTIKIKKCFWMML